MYMHVEGKCNCSNLVSSATRMRGPSGMTRPRCALIRQLVGPQCGHTWTPGCITEYFIWQTIKNQATMHNKCTKTKDTNKRVVVMISIQLVIYLTTCTTSCFNDLRNKFTGFRRFLAIFIMAPTWQKKSLVLKYDLDWTTPDQHWLS